LKLRINVILLIVVSSENNVCSIYKDNSNDLWCSTIGKGAYKYTNNEFINYKVPAPVMGILKDKDENIWFGCAGGLYRIEKDGKIKNVTTHGPWN